MNIVWAPTIDEGSWLLDDAYHREGSDVPAFLSGFQYLCSSTRGIQAMAGVDPEAAYWIWSLINHGIEFNQRHPEPVADPRGAPVITEGED